MLLGSGEGDRRWCLAARQRAVKGLQEWPERAASALRSTARLEVILELDPDGAEGIRHVELIGGQGWADRLTMCVGSRQLIDGAGWGDAARAFMLGDASTRAYERLTRDTGETAILMISGRLLFGMSWGSEPWLMIPIILSTSAAATSLGLMFSTLAKTEAQVSSLGNLILLSCAGISGCLVPRIWMSPLTQKISLFTPHAWALDAYGEVLTKNVPNHSVILQSCAVLMIFTSTFFIVGLVRFRRDS